MDSDWRGNLQRLKRSLRCGRAGFGSNHKQATRGRGRQQSSIGLVDRRSIGSEIFRGPQGCGLRPDNFPPAANRPRQSCAFRARD